MCATANGHRSIEHSGEVSGFVSDNEVLIDDGVAVAVLTNQDAVGAAIDHCASGRSGGGRLPAHRRRKAGPRPSSMACNRAASTAALLAPNLSDYFTAEALADFQSSLAPLGEPLTFRQTAATNCAAA